MNNAGSAFQALLASRKSIVGVGALVLVGLVYFFTDGDLTSKSVAMGAVASIAMTIIHAVGAEDAAAKGASTNVATVTNVTKPEDVQ